METKSQRGVSAEVGDATALTWRLLVVCLLFGPGGRPASALEPITVRSQSGQFIVRGLPMGAPVTGYSTSAVQYLRLDPALTAVSLERIHQAIFSDVGLDDKWRGLVTVTTSPVEEDNPVAQVISVHYADGWSYRVSLPERIDKDRFIKVAVQVILLEVANRTAMTREAELPPWLVEGLSAELQQTSLTTLALEPETQVARREHQIDPMRAARELLRQRPALKFDELSLPSQELLSGENAPLYQACAQVFVHDLLRLRNGRDCLRELIVHLSEDFNWQTTFLRAFSSYFERLIEVDKWYALRVANLGGRDPMSVWPLTTTWKQLDDILATPVQVRLQAAELPINTTVTLQRVIAEWEFARQQPVLLQKISRLKALQLRAAAELVELVDDYRRVIQSYVNGSQAKAGTFPQAKPAATPRLPPHVKTALQQLDDLDTRRETLRQRTLAVGSAR